MITKDLFRINRATISSLPLEIRDFFKDRLHYGDDREIGISVKEIIPERKNPITLKKCISIIVYTNHSYPTAIDLTKAEFKSIFTVENMFLLENYTKN